MKTLLTLSLAIASLPLSAQRLVPTDLAGILIPLPGSIAGANGSQWRTDIFIRTPQAENSIFLGPSPTCPEMACGFGWFSPNRVLSGSMWSLGSPMLVFAEPEVAVRLQVAIRAYDASRLQSASGTEIPAVPLTDFWETDFVLLNVPVGSETRGLTRVYGHPVTAGGVVGMRYLGPEGAILGETEAPMVIRGSSVAEYDARILYAELPLPDGMQSSPRLHIQILPPPGMRVWAMHTATNNATHHVTLVTP